MLVSVSLVVALAIFQPLVLLVIAVGIVPLWLATRHDTERISLHAHRNGRRPAPELPVVLDDVEEAAQELRAYQWGDRVASRHGDLWEYASVGSYGWLGVDS